MQSTELILLDLSIEAPPSVLPQRHYCDITGLEVSVHLFCEEGYPIDVKSLGTVYRSLDHAEPRPKSHILHVWPMLSHGVLICTSMLFFALWMGTPSPHLHDDIPVYCE
jgi:hypothetical protein